MTVIANPPLLLGQGSQGTFKSQVCRLLAGFWRILWQSVVPFNPRPEPPDDPPAPAQAITDDQFKQCQALYVEAEADRAFLEGKARATFSVITFLVPLLTSGILFFYARVSQHADGGIFALVFLFIAFVFLILGFISIVRAVSVQVRETLGIGAVINLDAGTVRAYDRTFHVRGMLYCASVNQAMNGHIAEFVKGAHILTALAVIAVLIAAVPSIRLLSMDTGPAKTQIVGSVEIAAPSLEDLKREVAKLGNDLAAIASDKSELQRMNALDTKIDQLGATIKQLQDEVQQLRNGGSGPGTTPKP